jgi:Carboxypeptidase regulatory-like domain
MRALRLLSCLVALSLIAVPMTSAQGTTGRMTGIVKDDHGIVLAGVAVSISSSSLIGGPRAIQTGSDGRFSFTQLAPGYYDIGFELPGFKPQIMKGVEVSVDRAVEVLPKLEVLPPTLEVGETITVIGHPPEVDVTRTGISTVFSADYLDRTAIGSQGRSYQTAIGRAPGADNGTGDPRVFGSTVGENAYYIDGIDTTDPVTETFGVNFNFDAIAEISFQTAGFAAEFGRATGGVVNIVTKSGGNQFSGTLDTRYNNNHFNENGAHFNRDTNRTEFLKPAATLGGPILHDTIWFFGSFEEIDSKSTPAGSALTSDFRGTDALMKVSFQFDPSWQGVAKYSADPARIDNFNAGLGVEPAAAAEQRQGGSIYQAEVSGTPSPQLLLQLQGGVNRGSLDQFPQTGNLDIPGIMDQVTGVSSNNYFNAQFSQRNRDELQASLTAFVDQALGSHEFKLGASQSNMNLLAKNNFSGGAFYQDFNGPIDPNAVLLLQEPLDYAHFGGVLDSAFLQDAWLPLPTITFQLGLRYDQITFKNDAGAQISDQHSLQPRLGFAIDLTSDAKTVLRSSYGLFMSPNALSLPSLTRSHTAPVLLYAPCSAFFSSAADCAAGGPFGPAGYLPNDPLHRDPLGYFRFNEFNTTPEIIQPGLKPMTTTEYTVALERQIFSQSTAELSYIHKRANDIFEDTCAENVPNPTVDPNESNCPTFEVANLPAAKRNYQGAILTLNSRPNEHLLVNASYVYSKSRGSIEYTQNAGHDFDAFPTLFVNRYGYLSDDRRHRVRLDGLVRLPLNWSVDIQSDFSSPFPYSKVTPALGDVEYLAPRGDFRANSIFNVNLEIRKDFLVSRLHCEAIGSVLNLLGTEQVSSVCENVLGCGGSIPWGGATGFTQPRHYEVGLRLVF